MKKQKEFTNEDLARMVQNGFQEMQSKVDKRFDHIEFKLDDIDNKLKNVAYRFELEAIEKRVEKLELKAGLRRS